MDTIGRIWQGLGKFRGLYVLSIFVAFVDGMLGALSVSALVPVALSFGSQSQTSSGALVYLLDADVGPEGALLLLGGLLCIKALVAIVAVLLVANIRRLLLRHFTDAIASRQLSKSYDEWSRQHGGQTLNRGTVQVLEAVNSLTSLRNFIAKVIAIILMIVGALLVDWRIVVFSLILGLLVIWLILMPLINSTQRTGSMSVRYQALISGAFSQFVAGAKDIRILGASDQAMRQMQTLTDKASRIEQRLSVIVEVPKLGIEVLFALLVASVALIYALLGDVFVIDVAATLFFVVASFRITQFATAGAGYATKFARRLPSFWAVMDELATLPIEKEIQSETDSSRTSQSAEAESIIADEMDHQDEKGLRVRSLQFSIDGFQILKGVDLRVPMGTACFVGGASGAGKSTLADCLAGLHRLQEGRIFVGHTRFSHKEAHRWHGLVSYVPQNPVLFEGTIMDNVRFATPEAEESEVERALMISGLTDAFASRPEVLSETMQFGLPGLSGGQRCRVAIARALIKKPQLLILDEALDTVEVELEAELLQRFKDITSMSVLVIGHRQSNLDYYDSVYMMSHGVLKPA